MDAQQLQDILERLKRQQSDDAYVEAKAAAGGLPKSIWETISAFANTAGGTLFLGVSETKRTFSVDGVQNAEKLESDFWNTLRNKNKISPFSIGTDAFEIIEAGNGKKIIRITVPQADSSEIPVHLNGDIRQTYIRRGEGDFLVNEEELKTLLRDSSPKSQDRVPLRSLSIDDLDITADFQEPQIIEENTDALVEQAAKDVDKLMYEKIPEETIDVNNLDSIETDELTEDDLNLIGDLNTDNEITSNVDFSNPTPDTPVVPIYEADDIEASASQTFEPGDKVTTAKYGEGIVSKMTKYGNKMLCLIEFPKIGRRLLDPAVTEITKLS